MTLAVIRTYGLDADTFARSTGLHPDLVRRFVALGLLDAETDPSGRQWFGPEQVGAARRLQRLRAGLCLNYAALGVVADLLDRIAELEAALRRSSRPTGDRQWISTD